MSKCAAQGEDFAALTPGRQFEALHREVSPELTRMLKRIRKHMHGRMRFLLVTEAHEGGGENDGMPHYHMLLHEGSPDHPVTHKYLSKHETWPQGFSKWKLVTDSRQVSYVTKYLVKATRARVRASESYGSLEPTGLKSARVLPH